jgi:hypothetical protein
LDAYLFAEIFQVEHDIHFLLGLLQNVVDGPTEFGQFQDGEQFLGVLQNAIRDRAED